LFLRRRPGCNTEIGDQQVLAPFDLRRRHRDANLALIKDEMTGYRSESQANILFREQHCGTLSGNLSDDQQDLLYDRR
jgi:hypothetical protein